MLQNFININDPTSGPIRLARLRKTIAALKLDGFLIPRADAHQSEIVSPHDERLLG